MRGVFDNSEVDVRVVFVDEGFSEEAFKEAVFREAVLREAVFREAVEVNCLDAVSREWLLSALLS